MGTPLMVRTTDIVNGDLWRLFPVINCDRSEDVPCDYPGAIGVPITFLDKLSREQFEIVDLARPRIGDRELYRRLIIRHLHPDLPEYIDLAEWLDRAGVDVEFKFVEEAVNA